MELMKKLVGLLGMPETATEDEVLMKLAEVMKPPVEAAQVPCAEKAGEDMKQAAALREAIVLASEPLKLQLAKAESERLELSKKVSALEADKLAHSTAELVRVSMARGVANAQATVEKILALTGSLDSAREILSMVPATVDARELGHSDGAESDDATSASVKLNAIALEIHKAENIDMSEAHLVAMRRNTNLARLVAK
jgi:hypothetical protein